MAVVDKPWDGSASRYPDTPSYCEACLINTNEGPRSTWTQTNCKLPIKEPNGDINKNALGSAAGALAGARGGLKGVSSADKKKAAKGLVRAYHAAGTKTPDIPESVRNMAS